LPGADIWIDKDDLRKSRNFEKGIPANLASSAVLILLVSPTNVDRRYCARGIPPLCQLRHRTQAVRAALRCSRIRCKGQRVLEQPDTWPTDIPFCDDIDTVPVASSQFEERFLVLPRGLVDLPSHAQSEHSSARLPTPSNSGTAHRALTRELHARSYRVVGRRDGSGARSTL
jgi:hypothetical protein